MLNGFNMESGFVTRSMVSVPLIAKGEVIGVTQIITKHGGEAIFSE